MNIAATCTCGCPLYFDSAAPILCPGCGRLAEPPAAGGPGATTATADEAVSRDPVPWEVPGQGWWARHRATHDAAVWSPRQFFSSLTCGGDMRAALRWVVLNYFILGALWGVIFCGFCVWGAVTGKGARELLWGAGALLLLPPLLCGTGVLGTYLIAGIDHVFLRMAGASGPFRDTVRVRAYQSGVLLYALIPYVGRAGCAIYSFVASVYGYAAVHRISRRRALAACVLPSSVVLALAVFQAVWKATAPPADVPYLTAEPSTAKDKSLDAAARAAVVAIRKEGPAILKDALAKRRAGDRAAMIAMLDPFEARCREAAKSAATSPEPLCWLAACRRMRGEVDNREPAVEASERGKQYEPAAYELALAILEFRAVRARATLEQFHRFESEAVLGRHAAPPSWPSFASQEERNSPPGFPCAPRSMTDDQCAFVKGLDAWRKGDVEGGRRKIAEAAKKLDGPETALAWLELAADRPAMALKALDDAIAIDAGCTRCLRWRSRVHLLLGIDARRAGEDALPQFDAAAADAGRMLELKPSDDSALLQRSAVHVWRGTVLQAAGGDATEAYAAAVADADAAVRADDDALSRIARGFARLKLACARGDPSAPLLAEAMADFSLGKSSVSRYWLGVSRVRAGQRDAGLADMREAAKVDSKLTPVMRAEIERLSK